MNIFLTLIWVIFWEVRFEVGVECTMILIAPTVDSFPWHNVKTQRVGLLQVPPTSDPAHTSIKPCHFLKFLTFLTFLTYLMTSSLGSLAHGLIFFCTRNLYPSVTFMPKIWSKWMSDAPAGSSYICKGSVKSVNPFLEARSRLTFWQ